MEKKYGIKDVAHYAGVTISEAYRLLSVLGIIGHPTQRFLTDFGKQYGEDKWIENDRYGRSYWLRLYSEKVIQMIKNAKDEGK